MQQRRGAAKELGISHHHFHVKKHIKNHWMITKVEEEDCFYVEAHILFHSFDSMRLFALLSLSTAINFQRIHHFFPSLIQNKLSTFIRGGIGLMYTFCDNLDSGLCTMTAANAFVRRNNFGEMLKLPKSNANICLSVSLERVKKLNRELGNWVNIIVKSIPLFGWHFCQIHFLFRSISFPQFHLVCVFKYIFMRAR